MPPAKTKAGRVEIRPRIRVYLDNEIALGPGKVELLTHLRNGGTLRDAARSMEMSYMKAWLLVQVMNRSFRKPLVKLERGGVKGGGARLTPAGERVIEIYQKMHGQCVAAMAHSRRELQRLLES